jgi:hypothetical protein
MIDLLKIALFYQPQLRQAVREQNIAAANEVRVKISTAVADAGQVARSFGLEVCVRNTTTDR